MRKATKPYFIGGALSMGLLLILGFQNCGELNPSLSAVAIQSSIESRLRDDRATLDRIMGSDTLKAWISTTDSNVTYDGTAITAVGSVDSTGVSLAPTASTSGPGFVASSGLSARVMDFSGTKNLRSSLSETKLTGSAYSVVAVLEAPLSGRLISIIGNDFGTEELSITVASGKLRVNHVTTSANNSWAAVDLTTTSGPIVIGASFEREPDKMSLQVNGSPVTLSIQTAGAPQNSSDTTRALVLGDSATAATMKLAEVYVFNKALTAGELNTVARFAGERNGFNGVAYDPSLTPPTTTPGTPVTDPNFTKVQPLIVSQCASCHFHSTWGSYTAQKFVDEGYVIKGNALGSKLYYRLMGSEGASGPKSMPQTTTLSNEELSTFVGDMKTWINSMQ